jgi:hypothetical protein
MKSSFKTVKTFNPCLSVNWDSFFAQSSFDKFEGQDDVTALIVKEKCLN